MMRITKLALVAPAVAWSLALSSALRAEEGAGAQQPGAMHHEMMPNMMGQMNQMKDQCTRMMQSANDRDGPKSPDHPQGTPPASPDSKG
jgi:periplasmic protein CpxP/Spy